MHFGYSPFIVQVARAQLALSLCYAHHETNSTSEDGHRVYKVTWTRAFSDVLEDEQDGEADAGRIWNRTAVNQLVNVQGFTQSEFDPCYFFKEQGGERVDIALYVDDGYVLG